MSTSRGNTTFGLLPESSLKWLWVNAKLSNRLNAIELSFLTSPDPSRKWKELSSRPQGLHVLLCFQHHISTSQHLNISNKNFFGACISYNAWVFVSWVRHQKGCVSLETRRCTEAKTHNHTPNANLRNSKKVVNSGNWNVYKSTSWESICILCITCITFVMGNLRNQSWSKELSEAWAGTAEENVWQHCNAEPKRLQRLCRLRHGKQCLVNALLCHMN